jgi:ferredoxin--NADP+ reductase
MSEIESELGPVCEAVVQSTVRITPEDRDEVRRMTLSIDDPSFRFREGQSIGVVVKGPHAFGNPYHMRRYSIANGRQPVGDEAVEIEILVRRCFYLDEVSGEQHPGIASNYLCDARPGDAITITGPYRSPFVVPRDENANLLMIGTGTGIAPFRAFIQHVYGLNREWNGQVRLFYGARTGMDLLYRNDAEDDLANFYDEKTFKAFKGLISKPLAQDEQALGDTLDDHAAEAWELMQDGRTYVYLAGLGKVAEVLDKVMARAAGSERVWHETRDWMRREGRWAELIYG